MIDFCTKTSVIVVLLWQYSNHGLRLHCLSVAELDCIATFNQTQWGEPYKKALWLHEIINDKKSPEDIPSNCRSVKIEAVG